ncbi:MAG: class I tRNA ligase family protein [Spirochaetia bacterium]
MAKHSDYITEQIKNRPVFPKRAVVTGGMPYGNKELHFGHIGGMFVHADIFSRFLRDRIGKDNVVFVSGTDCYGSPIVEQYRQKVESGSFEGSLDDFVKTNHERQKEVLDKYLVGINLYAASSFSRSAEIHREVSGGFLETLYRNGHLLRISKPQFYDPVREVFLNGRQVEGRCPVQGCSSDKAYADECSLGHQINPEDLIAPRSTLSGEKPVLKEAENWYLDMIAFHGLLNEWTEYAEKQPGSRGFVISSLREFLEPPSIFVLDKHMEEVRSMKTELPPFTEEESKSKSTRLIFESLEAREKAYTLFTEREIRFRTGKTLVPFRLTGNLDWGLPAPDIEDLKGLTYWVWPESLIAPISFVKTYLETNGDTHGTWKDYWLSKDAQVYQFIGEDNLYFYGLAELAIWYGMQGKNPVADPPEGELQLPHLIVNNHILFLDKKASSSGKVKPPMARDLLDHYTPEQLRAHFFSLGLGIRSVGFKPKFLNPSAGERDADPVMREGNLLSNAFNRAVRSCFYTVQQNFGGKLPDGETSREIFDGAAEVILEFERYMYTHEFHQAMAVLDRYIREINKYWTHRSKETADDDTEGKAQVLIDSFHMVKTAAVLAHPIAPKGTEMIREYLQLGEEMFSWERIFDTIPELSPLPGSHQFKFLEPRVDFFEKHSSQFKK